MRPQSQDGLSVIDKGEAGNMGDQILKLGIPAGSLQEATGELFRRAGASGTSARLIAAVAALHQGDD